MLELTLQDLHVKDTEREHHCGLEAPHDPTTLYLSLFLCAGVVVSYLPQHIRIIRKSVHCACICFMHLVDPPCV